MRLVRGWVGSMLTCVLCCVMLFRRSAPSASHRALAHAVAPAQAELQRVRIEGGAAWKHDSGLAATVSYSRQVRESLAKER
jgi:hypothetical protein